MSPTVRSKGAASTAGKSTKAKAVATQLATKKTANHGRSEVDELKKQLAEALDKRAEALKQQDATSEVLRVMSTSSTDVRPVLQAVAERAAFLCQAPFARVLLINGDQLSVAAEHSADGTVQAETHVPLTRGSFTGRAILDGSTVHFDPLRHAKLQFGHG